MKLERHEDGEIYLRVDEGEDVLGSLEHCKYCLAGITDEPSHWKWLIISLHNAVQGAMVCHLSGTAQLGALEKKSASRWLDHLTGSRCPRPAPREHLADFIELLSRLSSPDRRLELAGSIIEVTENRRRSLKKLNDLRRNFTHFTPKGWSIELSGMPKIIEDAIAIIEDIGAANWAFRHLEEGNAERLTDLLLQIRCASQGLLATNS